MFYIDHIISDDKSNNYFIILCDRDSSKKISYLVKEVDAERIGTALDSFEMSYTFLYSFIYDFINKNGWKISSITLQNDDNETIVSSIQLHKGEDSYISFLNIEDAFMLSILYSIDLCISSDLYEKFQMTDVVSFDKNNNMPKRKQDLGKLNAAMARSIKNENYELAASIRDQIKKIK